MIITISVKRGDETKFTFLRNVAKIKHLKAYKTLKVLLQCMGINTHTNVLSDEVDINYIFAIVCKCYQKNPEAVMTISRNEDYVLIRHITMYIAYNLMTRKKTKMYSLNKIGQFFDLTHSSVHHGIKKINNLCETNKYFAKEFSYIRKLVNL